MSDETLFPIEFTFQELGWKIRITYDREKLSFNLKVNDSDFEELPLQTTLVPQGPQNIETGQIVLNGSVINDKLETGFMKWSQTKFH